MDRLSIILTLMTGAVLTGGLAIAAFSVGYYGWPAVLIAACVGFAASWPVAYFLSRRIKRNDPTWDEGKKGHETGVPKAGEPEI